MSPAELIELWKALGAPGLIIGYVVWDRLRRDKLDEKRINADLQSATAFALLTEAIKGMRR